MNWHAILIISALAVGTGLLLYLPFFIWFRWRNANASVGSVQVTRLGFFWYAIVVVVIFCGLSVGHIAPQSWLGVQVRTFFGGLGFASAVCIVAALLERVFIKYGFVFLYREVPVKESIEQSEISKHDTEPNITA
jgi:hypothetical protein